jgi:hypothetical protein
MEISGLCTGRGGGGGLLRAWGPAELFVEEEEKWSGLWAGRVRARETHLLETD